MRSGTEYEPVLDLLVRVARDPTFRLVRVRVGVRFAVVQGKIRRGNDHGAFGSSVCGADGEILLGNIWNHDHGRAVSQHLLDNGACPSRLLKLVEADGRIPVPISGSQVLL